MAIKVPDLPLLNNSNIYIGLKPKKSFLSILPNGPQTGHFDTNGPIIFNGVLF
jgi:hypothetical protein